MEQHADYRCFGNFTLVNEPSMAVLFHVVSYDKLQVTSYAPISGACLGSHMFKTLQSGHLMVTEHLLGHCMVWNILVMNRVMRLSPPGCRVVPRENIYKPFESLIVVNSCKLPPLHLGSSPWHGYYVTVLYCILLFPLSSVVKQLWILLWNMSSGRWLNCWWEREP